jgi:hypothetical protein
MARDHRRLRVFTEAHELVLAIYRETRDFPRDEWFGDFVNVARGSAAEISYPVMLAAELGYLSPAGITYFGGDATTWCRSWNHWSKARNPQ